MRRSLAVALLVVASAMIFGAVWYFSIKEPAPPPAAASGTQEADGLRVTMQLDKTTPGERQLTVLLHNAEGEPVDAHSVHLRFTMAEMDMGIVEANAERVGRGYFRATGPFFSMVGRWNVEATVDDGSASPRNVVFVFPIAAPGEASGPLNPLAADEATLAMGRSLYADNCAVCHGVAGKGDGPAAVGLRPAPGDFTQHMQHGKHTDGQVFLWIRDGYPGTAMPAWKQRLSDEQIWQLVTFLRTFAQSSSPQDVPQPTEPPLLQPSVAPQAAILPPLFFVRSGAIWRSRGDTSEPQPVSTLQEGQYAEYPALAPDGKQIAFVATTQGPLKEGEWPLENPETSLYTIGADGVNLRLLWKPEGSRLGLTAWSPDGAAVFVGVYTVRSASGALVTERSFQIVRVDAQSGAQSIMMDNAYDPTVSADGTQIAFLRWHNDLAAFTLNVAALDGSNEREVIPWGAFPDFYAPRFSPDGKQIVFASTGGPPVDEQGFPIKGGAQSPLEPLLGLFAPAVAEAHGAASEIWIVNSDGSELRRLTKLREDTPMAVFSVDGQSIVVMGAGGIYQMKPDGSDLEKIDALGDHGGLVSARP